MREFLKQCLPQHAVVKLLLIGSAAVNYVGHVCLAKGESMMPTINPDPDALLNDVVWVNTLDVNAIKAGDVVTLVSPTDPRKRFLKRVLAMPGEWVYCAGQMVLVPPGHCWVQGDNKRNSYDSQAFGPVPLGLLLGRASHIIFPFHHIKRLQTDTEWRSSVIPDTHELATTLNMDEESIRALESAYLSRLNK